MQHFEKKYLNYSFLESTDRDLNAAFLGRSTSSRLQEALQAG